jgi:hypothetical protein
VQEMRSDRLVSFGNAFFKGIRSRTVLKTFDHHVYGFGDEAGDVQSLHYQSVF